MGLSQLCRKCSMTPRGLAASRIVFSMSNKSIFSACFSRRPRERSIATLLPDLKIRSFEDLLSPALKGKLVSVDPRVGGAGESLAAAVFQRYGRDGLKKLFVDQDVLLVKGNLEVAEQVVRKARPISLTSVSPDSQVRFTDAGMKLNLERSVRSRIGSRGNQRILPGDFQESAQSKRHQGFYQLVAFPRRPETHCRGEGRTQRAHRCARNPPRGCAKAGREIPQCP